MVGMWSETPTKACSRTGALNHKDWMGGSVNPEEKSYTATSQDIPTETGVLLPSATDVTMN